jgi:hypothetical protein
MNLLLTAAAATPHLAQHQVAHWLLKAAAHSSKPKAAHSATCCRQLLRPAPHLAQHWLHIVAVTPITPRSSTHPPPTCCHNCSGTQPASPCTAPG